MMDEISPGEVIEVAVLASHDETGRYDSRCLAGLRAVGVNVTNLVGAVRRLQLEEAAPERGQPPTIRADHPPGAWSHGDAHPRRGVELVALIGVRHDGGRP